MANTLADIANAERAQRLAQMAHTGKFDNEAIRAQRLNDVLRTPGRLAQGAFTGLVGAPVDIANMALQPIGLGSERPVGGSNYLASLINAPTESVAYQAGTMLPIGPEGLAMGGAKLAGLAGLISDIRAPKWNTGRASIPIGENPTPSEIRELLRDQQAKSAYNTLRTLTDKITGKVYVWPADAALHQDVGVAYGLNPLFTEHGLIAP